MAETKTKKNNRRSSDSRKKATGSSVRTSTRKKKGTKRTGADREPKGIPMKNEIELITSFGVMLILMLSNFGCCGTVGVWLSSFFFGIFGCVQYVLPIAFFFAVTVLLANDYSVLAMKKCVAGFVALTMISAFAQLIYQKDVRAFYDLFAVAVADHRAGGVVGGGLGLLLKNWFGTPGAIVIISCILILSLVMLTQRSFVGFFRETMEKIRGWNVREKISFADRMRAKQCEDKILEMEGQQKEEISVQKTEEKPTRGRRTAAKTVQKKQPDIRIHVSEFISDEGKPKDAVKELHPEIYPFTEEDGKTPAFEGELDFTAFSFNSGKTPEEFSRNFQEEVEEAKYKAENTGKHTRKQSSLPEEIWLAEDSPELIRETEPEETVTESERILPEEAATEPEGIFSEEAATEPEEIFSEEVVTEPEGILPEEAVTEPEGIFLEEAVTEPEGIFSEEAATEPEEILPEEAVAKPEEIPRQETVTKTKLSGKTGEVFPEKPRGEITPRRAAERQKGEKETPTPTTRPVKKTEYIFPPMNLLVTEKQKLSSDFDKVLKETAMKLQSTLESFGVHVTITDISCGPTVTRYEMFPEQGTKVSKILSLTDDIKLNLAASDIRIEAPIPGKAAIGIEVPNKQNMTVHFRELVDSRVFRNFKSKTAFAVGKDIGGKIVVADLAKMPHLLIAGATGSGKSVCINTLIMSILYKASPSEVKLIMIDPKMVELSTYNGIPHLLIPVVTDPKKASGALNWAVAEMTDRYKKFTETNVRNIEGYNKKVAELLASGEVREEKLTPMPKIVIIIDELADLMMVAPGEVEDAIVRLSQLARAAGIHLVIATQRPSVNVITGLIKANVPSRIAFSVSSGVDSRTIIDMNGAEKLLGKGDMLFYPSGYQKPVRVQGAFVSDAEVGRVVEFLKENETVAEYDTAVAQKIEKKIRNGSLSGERDEYFEAAARFIMEKDKATIGMLQRMFKIGFNRAARIIDQMADAGIVGPEEGTKPRKILMSPEQLEQYFEENL